MPLGMEVGLGPGHIELDGYEVPPKGAQQPPSFWPMSIVAQQSPVSATAAEHLFVFLLCYRTGESNVCFCYVRFSFFCNKPSDLSGKNVSKMIYFVSSGT